MYGEIVPNVCPDILPFSPSTMNIFTENFTKLKTLYSSALAATEIILVEDRDGKKYAVKEIIKAKLKHSYLQELIRNEIALQFSLCKKSENIVKVPEYFEDEERYVMLMEHSPQSDYFEDLLENVSIESNLEIHAHF